MKITKCLFPVAGYGTRFLPATKSMPKEMLPIVNKPLVQYGVEEAIAAGMTTCAMVTGRGKRAIADHFDISYELEHQISGSGKVGVLFRDEGGGKDFWANRNVLEKNRIIDSGQQDGIAIDVQGRTKDVKIVGNELRETREPAKRVGIRLAAGAERIELADNRIEGFSQPIRDERPAQS